MLTLIRGLHVLMLTLTHPRPRARPMSRPRPRPLPGALPLVRHIGPSALAWISKPRRCDERGASAVDWLIITGVGIGIAYFAGDSVMAFAKTLVGQLGT